MAKCYIGEEGQALENIILLFERALSIAISWISVL